MNNYRNVNIEHNGLEGANEVKHFDLESALHFSIENTGTVDVHIGFSKGDQPLPLKVNQGREFPWVDPDCMRYQGTLYVKFAAKSSVIITALYDTN